MRTKFVVGAFVASVALTGCHRTFDGGALDPRERQKSLSERVRELQEHAGAEDSAGPARLGPAPRVPAPPPPSASASGPLEAAPKVPGVAEYRERIARLGEKQLLADMQVVLASAGSKTGALPKEVLDGMVAQLARIDEAQRARDSARGMGSDLTGK